MIKQSESEFSPPEQLISGRWVILAIAALAVSMAAGGWLYWYAIGNEIHDYWGTETATLIAGAPQAELYRLGTPLADTSVESAIAVGDQWYPIVQTRNLLKPPAPGWTHVRTLLVRDAAFDFLEPAEQCQPTWNYALRFADGPRQAIVVLSIDCPRLRLADGIRQVSTTSGMIRTERLPPRRSQSRQMLSIAPMAAGLKDFLDEQFMEQAKSAEEPQGGELPAAQKKPATSAEDSHWSPE